MASYIQAEKLIAAAEAEIDACARRRREMVLLLRDVERRVDRARRSAENKKVHVREAAEIRCQALESVANRMRKVLK